MTTDLKIAGMCRVAVGMQGSWGTRVQRAQGELTSARFAQKSWQAGN